MNIFFISVMAGLPWGGSEELWLQTAIAAKEKDHKVLVCVYNWEPEPPQVTNLAASGIEVVKFEHPVKQPQRFYKRAFNNLTGAGSQQKFRDNLEKITRFKPDVICVSQGATFNISTGEYLYNYLINTTIPFVIICHHNNEYGGGFSNQQAYFEKQLFDKASSVLFVAQRNLEVAERQLGTPIKNAAIIGNPIKVSGIHAEKSVYNNGLLKMACVARLETGVKGQDILLQALASDNWRVRLFQLELYGSGPDREYIERLISFYQLTDKVKIAGYTNNVEKIWQDNHILILPSLSEGTPLSLVEAMLCNRPALATDVGGISSYVINGVTGFLAPAATVSCLSAALENLWNHRERLDKIGNAAYKHASKITVKQPEITLLNTLIKAVKIS